MERLTRRINGVVVYVGAKNPYSTGQIPCEVEPAGVREMMDRLAAYEDTRLTPERCAEFARADAEGRYIVMRDAEQEGVARLRELAEADKGGRVVVLPCKVGDTVWAILDGAKYARECKIDFVNIGSFGTTIVFVVKDGLREQYGVTAAAFGKTVFLTRKEAEKALEAMKDGDKESV